MFSKFNNLYTATARDQAVFNDAVESLVEGHVTYTRALGRSVRADAVDMDAWKRRHLGMVPSPSSGEWGVPAGRLKPNVGPVEAGEAGLEVRLSTSAARAVQIEHSQISRKMGLRERRETDAASSSRTAVPMRNAAATETVVQAPGWLVSGWISQFGGDGEETGAWWGGCTIIIQLSQIA